MSKVKVEDVVFEICKPVTDKHNFELVEIEYKKEGGEWYLRIYIDKEGGITIDDCQLVSEEVSELLDEIDPIDSAYIFEVSSPGIERPLKTQRDYEKSMGKLVEAKLFAPVNGKKAIEGILTGYSDDNVELDQNNIKIVLDKKQIAIIKPVIVFKDVD
ncbi:MAG: ribosome maturation factor RimP [Clostridiales bacterium GWB2_37_7]|nr:MAG: ribosome maturation factor RimP [Clostridiales bacterium GWB2_37_7]